jgi:hypothetical protein
LALTLAFVLISFADLAAAEAAKPAQISGKITGLPAKTDGGRAVQVVAIHLPDGAVVDGDRTSNGRYAIEVPKGFNALLTQVVAFGETKSTSVLSAAIKAKPGERLKLKLRAKKRKRKPGHGNGHHHGRAVARAAGGDRVIAEDGREYPGESFAFRQFTGATGKWAFANGGLPDMFTSDFYDVARPACDYQLVERRRFDAIADELALSQSGLVDPEHAVEPGHLIPVELWIEGTLTNAFDPPAPLRYEIRIVEAATGTVRTTLKGLLGGDGTFFADQAALAHRLSEAMCAGPTVCPLRASCGTGDPPPPVGSPHYSGPISGQYTATGLGPTPLKIDWTGNAQFTLTNEFSSPPFGSGLPEPGPYAHYETSGGSVHATLSATDFQGCTLSGAADIAITAGAPYGFLDAQEGVATPAYRLVIHPGPADKVPYTVSGAGASCTGTGEWPLDSQQAFARTPTPQTSPSSILVGSATFEPGAGQTETYDWNLTPGP